MFKWKTYIFILSGIFPLLFADIAFAQTLTLYTYPPAHPYRWENPHRLLVSTLNNYYFGTRRKDGRLIGHMIIELKKDSSPIIRSGTGVPNTRFARYKAC